MALSLDTSLSMRFRLWTADLKVSGLKFNGLRYYVPQYIHHIMQVSFMYILVSVYECI